MPLAPDNFISTGAYDNDVVNYLNALLPDAIRKAISDIHILVQNQHCYVQFRDGGKMVDVDKLPAQFGDIIDTKIRARSNLNKADLHKPVDGRMSLIYDAVPIDVRVAITPTVSGLKIVLRLLNQATALRDIADIPMSLMVRQCIEEIISDPDGLFLVSGPTGSGKTTLLYSIIKALHNGERNIITLENPVEYTLHKITQMEISPHMTFANGLRSVLRQDPDVVLVGEIRDSETAKIAVEAANTGHLVLATLHANNSAMSILRMLDLGVDPQTLASCLRCVTAQRLVKKTVSRDKMTWKLPSGIQKEWLSNHKITHDAANFQLPFDNGSKDVFFGRTPIIEMIKVDAAVASAIESRSGPIPIIDAAINQPQFESLAAAGIRIARQGITSYEQVCEAVGKESNSSTRKSEGQLLIEKGVIDEDDLYSLLECQAGLRNNGIVKSLETLAADWVVEKQKQLKEVAELHPPIMV
jgi:general secretion pathway protein E